jgi:hypothetical protein
MLLVKYKDFPGLKILIFLIPVYGNFIVTVASLYPIPSTITVIYPLSLENEKIAAIKSNNWQEIQGWICVKFYTVKGSLVDKNLIFVF